MATSSGTEVDVEAEEEVEYVEEVIEYEEVEDEEEDKEQEQEQVSDHPTPLDTAVKQPTEVPHVEQLGSKESDSDEQEEEEEEEEEEEADDEAAPMVPHSTSASELPAPSTGSAHAQSTPPKSGLDGVTESAAGSTAADSQGNAGGPVDFKQLEVQAAKVAKEVSQVALDVSSKLTAGLRSAFGGAEQSASGAGASLTKLAGGLSSWWGSLDPAPQPVRDETAEMVASSNKASGELQELFGLAAEENLVEHFKCKLLQTYSCGHNPHTPAIQMAFQGTLYVTDRHTCFSVEERGRKVPFKVTHNQVVKATRQRPARKGDLSDVLKMELSNGQWLAFKDFESGSALDSALALVEHLMEGS